MSLREVVVIDKSTSDKLEYQHHEDIWIMMDMVFPESCIFYNGCCQKINVRFNRVLSCPNCKSHKSISIQFRSEQERVQQSFDGEDYARTKCYKCTFDKRVTVMNCADLDGAQFDAINYILNYFFDFDKNRDHLFDELRLLYKKIE